MRTRVEEWNCSVDVQREVVLENNFFQYTFMDSFAVRKNTREKYTFHFRYWKPNELFKNMAYSFEANGYVDWDEFIANSPIGMIKFKDLINFTKKRVPYKLIKVQRSCYR